MRVLIFSSIPPCRRTRPSWKEEKVMTKLLWFFAMVIPITLLAQPDVNRSWEKLTETLEPGRAVVVTRMNSANMEGKLLDVTADGITVRWKGQPQTIRKEDVFRVRYANIRRKNTLLGMAIGAGGGLLAGLAHSSARGGASVLGSMIGVGAGAAVGGAMPIGGPLYQAERQSSPASSPAATGEE
jgi:hypothetical protein